MLRTTVDSMLAEADMGKGDSAEVMETYRMFAHSRSWLKRMEEDIGAIAERSRHRAVDTLRRSGIRFSLMEGGVIGVGLT